MEELDDSQLIEGFLAGDRQVTALFVTALLALIRSECARRWGALRGRADDVESRALYLLTKWKGERTVNPADPKLRPDQTLNELGALLVKRAAKVERKAVIAEKKSTEAAREIEAEPRPAAATAEEEAVAGDLAQKIWGLVAGMKAQQQAALRAWEAAQHGGPPLAEALGMEPPAARKLLERAREALLARAKAAKLDLAPWLTGEEKEAAGG